MQSPRIPSAVPESSSPEVQIGPYRLLALLGRGGMGSIHLAQHRTSGLKVALKTVRVSQASMMQSIRREIAALSRIRHPGIVRVLDMGVERGMPWYAMELLEGHVERAGAVTEPGTEPSRSGRVYQGHTTRIQTDVNDTARDEASAVDETGERIVRPSQKPGAPQREITEILSFVYRLCLPLAKLHGEGIVHRDLKPENILLRADGTPVLVDFGLASSFAASLSRETLDADLGAVGTALFMAPELLRGELVDARVDLYALGCILYELLTGTLPVLGFTLSELLHQHEHSVPLVPSHFNPSVSEALDDLVMKLLAKDPGQRIGYAMDVAQVLADLGATIPSDTSDTETSRYLYRADLVGRAGALHQLDAFIAEAGSRSAKGRVALVRGESGVGKTRLSLELARRARSRGYTVLAGQALEHASRPLELFRPALLALADRCRERGPAEVALVFGTYGKVLAPYEPSIEELPGLSALPPPVDLPPEASRTRLFSSLASALNAGSRDRPMLLLLDDLHWADELSLGFLRFLTEYPVHGLFCVGTLRVEEQSDALGLLWAKPSIQRIDLERLKPSAVKQVVAQMLAVPEPQPWLVDFVASHSEGNPLFIGEYLRELLQRGLTSLGDATPGGERAMREAVEALALPDSLRDLVAQRLAAISPEARCFVEVAALVGRDIDLDLTVQVSRLPDESTLLVTHELLRRQLLESSSDGTLRFAHDKVREGACGQLDAARARSLHQQIADTLSLRRDESGEHIYALARHYALGDVASAPQLVVDTNTRAARRALRDDAPLEASAFFKQAEHISRDQQIALDARFFGDWGSASIRLERWSDAIHTFQTAVTISQSPVERAGYRKQLAFALLTQPDAPRAWSECVAAFEDLGAPIPKSAFARVTRAMLDWSKARLFARYPELNTAPSGAEAKRLELLASLYRIAMAATYYQMDAKSWCYLAPCSLYPAERIGPSRHMVEAYAAYAVGMASFKLGAASERYSRRALELSAQLMDPHSAAIAELHRGNALSFLGDSQGAVTQMRRVLDECERWLDGPDSLIAAGELLWNLSMRGHARDAWEAQQFVVRKLSEARGEQVLLEGHSALAQALVFLPMLGLTSEAEVYLERAQRLAARDPDNRYNAAFIHCHLVMYYCETGELGAPLEAAIETYRKNGPPPLLTLVHMRSFYVFQTYARLSQWDATPDTTRPVARRRFERALAELSRVATLPTLPVLTSHLHLLRGAHERRLGHAARADTHFARAASEAARIDSPWVAFEVACERSRAAFAQGEQSRAMTLSDVARGLAREHGWHGRLARWDSELSARSAP